MEMYKKEIANIKNGLQPMRTILGMLLKDEKISRSFVGLAKESIDEIVKILNGKGELNKHIK